MKENEAIEKYLLSRTLGGDCKNCSSRREGCYKDCKFIKAYKDKKGTHNEKNKQIEEMAADIRLNMQVQPNPKEHPSHQMARLLVKDGYRKASEVAREIFAEIEKILEVDKYGEAKLDVRELYKIEKKYTEEEE